MLLTGSDFVKAISPNHEGDEGGHTSTSDGSAGESQVLPSAMTMARLLLLVKENQLATAAILFCAWQAGLFIEAWYTIQGVCQA